MKKLWYLSVMIYNVNQDPYSHIADFSYMAMLTYRVYTSVCITKCGINMIK